MTKTLYAAAILTTALCAGAADFASVTSVRYPDADAVTVEENVRVKYNPDGTYVETSESWTKLLTEKGRRAESSQSLGYSKRYGAAAIEYVGAIGTDGVERAIDVSATMKDATDNDSMSMNIYDPLDRVITCTVPGLKVGETLHLKTRRETFKARCQDKWADIAIMEWSRPIVKSTWEIVAPAARPLRKIAVRHPLGNVTESRRVQADGSTVHTFVSTNSPQAFPEPDMPALYTQVQNIRVSTAESWPEISKWYWELSAPHLAKTNAAMVAKVREIAAATAGGTWEAQVRALFKFVSQEVRYMGLTMEDTSPGYAPHDVDITFDNRYGVCRDKAALLVAMFWLAGFEAYPVLIHVGTKHDPEVPQPFFNHAIVAVVDNRVGTSRSGKGPYYLLMDPTNENAKDLFPAYENDKSYLVCRPDGDTLRTSSVQPAEENALKVDSKGTLAADGSLFLESRLAFDGVNDTIYRHAFVKMKGEDRRKFFERVLKRVAPGAELVRCEVEPKDMRDTESPVRVTLAAKLPEMLLKGETRSELNVPYLTRTLGMANFLLAGNTSLEKRRYPLVVDSTALVSETVAIDLGASVGAVSDLPRVVSFGEGCAYHRSCVVTNGQLRSRREMKVSKVEFDPKEYLAVREDLKRIEAAERQRPVFAKDPLAEADVRYLLDANETTVFSDKAWVTTNTVVKEVLTYNGKKRSSELKFPFNPQVGFVTVASAVVSNRDGRVFAATAKEQNVMDADWVARAPRYPASKLLVVNLPSVEIGSTIAVTVVETVTNAPLPFYGAYTFASHEPMERVVARVNGWCREVVRPKRIPNEPGQPPARLWGDVAVISSNRFAKVDLKVPSLPFHTNDVKAIRDWMAKNVKVAGPSLYELPLAQQLTDPQTVLKERYASRLDYVRTLTALLKGAGVKAAVVFAADNAAKAPELRRRDRVAEPDVSDYDTALCRAVVDGRTLYFGTENEYAELGTSAYDGSDFFDPSTGRFGEVSAAAPALRDCESERTEVAVRENGSVDMTIETKHYGSSVAAFRRKYAEILPEERARLHQSLLGAVAQAASATGELEADVEGYPAVRRFACHVPDYATVQGDAITLQLPPMIAGIPTFAGGTRTTPFAVAAADAEDETVTVTFPEGYVEIEHVPEDFALTAPGAAEPWLTERVTTAVRDGVLTVTVTRRSVRRAYAWFGPEYVELVRDYSRIANARANRTISVRRRSVRNP